MIRMQDIFHKIREICEACYQGSNQQIRIPRNYKNVALSSPERQKEIPQVIIKQYLTALECLEYFTQQLRQFKQQYENLEQSLQKQELEIRKHIGIQQQLRLYSEGVKGQLQECEKEKLQLLENSKVTIKNLKLKNQMLFEELSLLKKKTKEYQKVTKTYQHTSVKSKIKQKSLSASGDRKDSSLSKIIKTQYIERQKIPFLNVNIRKQLKYKSDAEFPDKKHKHYKSTFLHQEPHTSQSKKKHHLEFLEKCKKEKSRHSNTKQFDLGMYINKNQLKKSPFKNIQKSSNKQHSSKKRDKQNKSSYHEKFQKVQTDNKHRKDEAKEKIQDNKQRSKSKESRKKIKSKQKLKQKFKQPKKATNHNKSLFSVSSVQYRTNPRTTSEK